MPIVKKILNYVRLLRSLDERLHRIQQALGRIENRQVLAQSRGGFNEHEFRTYSQWGEDGLIQHLIRGVPIERNVFVEFGVESYVEANTRFLLVNDNWSGLVLDASEKNIHAVKSDPIYWRHDLKAECTFVDRENINQVIARNEIRGDIGLLSIDIDGNDYWLWEAIDVVSPRLVVCEYNSLWGAVHPVSIPYEPQFVRHQAHYSGVYYGASIAALAFLGKEKGYTLVGSNLAGNNAFFVRDDVLGPIAGMAPEQAWVTAKFREARDQAGRLTYSSAFNRLADVAMMPLVDVTNQRRYTIGELFISH